MADRHPPKQPPAPTHLVFDAGWKESYERAGFVATEVRPGAWRITNPRSKWGQANV